MDIAAIYSFNDGQNVVKKKYSNLYKEIEKVIAGVDANRRKTKKSKEKTRAGKILYGPRELNSAFKEKFFSVGWRRCRIPCEYSIRAFREIGFVKNKLGVEVQFSDYACMTYDVCAKMVIFKNQNLIDAGVEIVPIKQFANEMSTGVSYFEQFVWDLEHRGVSNIDIPVLILGIDA